jgi:hypothetical protein
MRCIVPDTVRRLPETLELGLGHRRKVETHHDGAASGLRPQGLKGSLLNCAVLSGAGTVSKWMQQHERADELILNELHTLDFSIDHFVLASRVGPRL